MKNLKLITVFTALSVLTLSSCKKDEESTTPANGSITMSISGLEDLGADYQYEGWLIVDGSAISAGTFTVDAAGNMSKTSFSLTQSNITNATTYVLTIEPVPDADPSPSDVHILAGDFSGSTANLIVSHDAALGDDFTASTGGYILATPTDGGMNTNENSGVWWLDPAMGPGAGLALPTLPNGWMYEGWAVIDGTPVSTGKFTDLAAADKSAIFSDIVAAGPPFPGEDFLLNAPSGLTFPVDLAGKTVVISVEPSPDNSAAPFLLKPLVGSVPMTATDHTLYNMANNATATNPTGTVSK